MNRTKKTLAFFCAALLSALAFAEEPTGYDIARLADSVDEGKTSSYTATMTLTNKKGAKRVREVLMKEKVSEHTKKNIQQQCKDLFDRVEEADHRREPEKKEQ